ncbi:hypothetical protein ACVRXS_10215 [Streptococcus orisratti]|uniref:hypothetical protein n=1 Tax=Streptococcus orisratti TaxID=114652 RepID=UPI00047675A6|nr:hypothetical protein [Streptococcus orisratti]
MKILVDRDSVCIGDDVLPHEMEFDVDDTMTVQDFFVFLEMKKYLPSIQGNDVAWELCNGGEEIAVYFTKDQLLTNSSQLLKGIIEENNGNNLFVLLYHCTPEAYLERKNQRESL